MKGVFLVEGGEVEIRETPVPEIGSGELLVEMKACGICGTDLEKTRGEFLTPPVLGHEVTGRVSEIGDGVEGFQVEERVVVHHHVPCYRCHYCRSGSHTMCERFPLDNLDPGGFVEYFRVSEELIERGAVMHLPDEVSFVEGTFVEPTGCCVRALRKGGFDLAESVAVVGAGPAGLLHTQLLSSLGAVGVFVTDISDLRLGAARSMGATAVFNPREDDPVEEIRERTDGRGVDLVIVATGSVEAIAQAVEMARKGGRVLLFGTPHKDTRLPLDVGRLFIRETEIIPSYSTTESEMREALRLIRKGVLDVASIVSHRFTLDAFQEALSQAGRASESLKVIVHP